MFRSSWDYNYCSLSDSISCALSGRVYSHAADIKFTTYNQPLLTHWGRETHICMTNLTIIGSDNGLSPGRRQAIIWTNVGISSIGPLGTNFSEILIQIQTFSFTKMHLKMSSAKWRPFCPGLNELIPDTKKQLPITSRYSAWIVFHFIKIMWYRWQIKSYTFMLRFHKLRQYYIHQRLIIHIFLVGI